MHIKIKISTFVYVFTYNFETTSKMRALAEFVKERRKLTGLTQEEFADRSGVALTVLRKVEQGKTNLNLDKVNLILGMFGHELAPVKSTDIKE